METLTWNMPLPQSSDSHKELMVEFQDNIKYQLTTTIAKIDNSSPMVTELFVKAPLAAKKLSIRAVFPIANL